MVAWPSLLIAIDSSRLVVSTSETPSRHNIPSHEPNDLARERTLQSRTCVLLSWGMLGDSGRGKGRSYAGKGEGSRRG